jgi:signal transduction histidine kinase
VTNQGDDLCTLVQEIGLPAVRVELVSADVVGMNALFLALVNAEAPLEDRVSFVERVLPRLSPADRTSWEAAFANQRPLEVPVQFRSVDGRSLDFDMRSCAVLDRQKLVQTFLCVFVPLSTPTFERVCDESLSEGRELERSRIRQELHRGVSQQLLGAAFGCKVLAGRIAPFNEELAKEASDLAELVNGAVTELQSLVQSVQTPRKQTRE